MKQTTSMVPQLTLMAASSERGVDMHRLLRRLFDTAFRAARELEVKVKGKKLLKNLIYYPLIENEEALSDILNRANWYFPEKSYSEAQITIPISSELSKHIKDFSKLVVPQTQENYIKKNKRIVVTPMSKEELSRSVLQSDAVLLWRAKELFRIPQWIMNLDKVWIVDKNYFLVTEVRNYIWLFNETVPQEKMQELLGVAKKNFEKFRKQISKYKKAYVFGTGPSVSKAFEFDFSDGFSIVTNTMVNDEKMMRHIKPVAIVHGDFVYHMGPSIYASRFREQLFSKYGKELYSLIRFDIMPFLISVYPELEEKFVAFPMKLFAGSNIPSQENYYLNLSNNSLVGYMLPVSCSIVDEIFILGCDGRKPEDKLFWSHAKTVFYADLQKTLVETHPSVYRDTDFKVYYHETINDVDAFMKYAERKRKKFVSLTPSYIPALHRHEKK